MARKAKNTENEQLSLEGFEEISANGNDKEEKKAHSKAENVKEIIGSDGKAIKAVKSIKKSSLGLKKKYNDIEDLKNDLFELNKQGVDIVQADVVAHAFASLRKV